MTSGPMRAGALPPDRQPDPQVIAWMRGYRDNLPPGIDPGTARMETVREYRNAHREEAQRLGLRALVDAYAVAACKPLTVADIPAGQGPASLYIATDGRGRLAAWFMRGDGHAMHLLTDPGPDATAAEAALWDHLAATLPTVDTVDVDVTPLFTTPQIHTDDDGRHWDDAGREHRAVDIDGEITYQPTVDTTEEST